MSLPKVVIIGRPNVGKSSLFNALAGSYISIVEPTAGVTRDRVSAIIEKNGLFFELIDTGGYPPRFASQNEAGGDLSGQIEYQIRQALSDADICIFMVDIRDGLLPLDREIAQVLRRESQGLQKEFLDSRAVRHGQAHNERRATGDERRGAPKRTAKKFIIGVANKADEHDLFPEASEFISLGFGEFICISVINNLNKNVLLEKIIQALPKKADEKPKNPVMKIAIVGRPNTGKSSLVNAIAGEERVIVSEVPCTTRDAVDVRFEKDGRSFVVIDTAGVRKKISSKPTAQGSIEFYASVRAMSSIRRADVVFLIIDSTVPVSTVDKKLSKLISDEYKSCIIVVNKWDLAKDRATTGEYKDYLTTVLPALKNAPIAFTTATGYHGAPKFGILPRKCDTLRLGAPTKPKNIQSLLDLAGEIFKQALVWIPTPKLNKAVEVLLAQAVTRPSWPCYHGLEARGTSPKQPPALSPKGSRGGDPEFIMPLK